MASMIVDCQLYSNINCPMSSFNSVVTRTVTDDVNMELQIGGVSLFAGKYPHRSATCAVVGRE